MKLVNYKNLDNLDLQSMTKEILDEVACVGYVIIRNTGFDLDDTCKEQLLNFCRRLGQLVPHNYKADSLIWDIKSVKHPQSTFITHSERNVAAELHTDSTFSDDPEDFFCLYTIKKSDCGGGESLLLSASDLLKELRSTDDGRQAEEVLRTKAFPFAVPTVFKKEVDVEHEHNDGLILTEAAIRFRGDTIEESINRSPSLVDSSQIKALNTLQNLLRSSTLIKRIMMEPGDLILINNKTMLHGRTGFNDKSRHLLRVRVRLRKSTHS